MSGHALFSARLLEFNLLPSRTLHPSRNARYGTPDRAIPLRLAPAWHRHCSREILRRLNLTDRPVRDTTRPELILALMPPDRMARLARHVGAIFCASRLRRAIRGNEVRELTAGLGADVLDFARRAAPAVPTASDAADGGIDALEAAALPAGIDRLGYAALAGAFRCGGAELALRAELKLPDLPVQPAPCEDAACLDVALAVLKLIDSSWHSSFPAMR